MAQTGRLVRKTEHDTDAGILAVYSNGLTGKFVCLYDGAAQGLDTDAGKYTLLCTCHGLTLSHNNRAQAAQMARNPTEWCEECRDADDELQALAAKIKGEL
jgi:hypothetical protein